MFKITNCDLERWQGIKHKVSAACFHRSPEQSAQLTQAGHKLAALIGDNLSTESTKTTIELNLAVLKITHEVTRTKKRK